jgi:hypothetical protein
LRPNATGQKKRQAGSEKAGVMALAAFLELPSDVLAIIRHDCLSVEYARCLSKC